MIPSKKFLISILRPFISKIFVDLFLFLVIFLKNLFNTKLVD